MSRSLRALALACVTLVCLAATAVSAQAITVSPAGSVSATSGTTRLTLTSLGTGITCTSSRIAGSINTSGVGSVPTGGATYSGCNSPILGAFTVRQNSPWDLRVVLLASPLGVALVVTLDTADTVTLDGSICDLVVTGSPATITLLTAVTSLPFSTSGRTFPVTSSTGLRIQSSTCALIPAGLAATYGGTYAVSPAQTVSG